MLSLLARASRSCAAAPTAAACTRHFSGDGRLARVQAVLEASEVLKPARVHVEGTDDGCPGGHIRIEVHSAAFAGKPLVAQHRLVTDIVKEEIADVHAVQVHTRLRKD